MIHVCSKTRQRYGDNVPKKYFEYSWTDVIKWGNNAPKKTCAYCGKKLR